MQSKGQFPRGTRGKNPDAPWADEWPGECQLQDQGPCPPVRDLGETLLRSTSLVPKAEPGRKLAGLLAPQRKWLRGTPGPVFTSASLSPSWPLPIPKAPSFRPSCHHSVGTNAGEGVSSGRPSMPSIALGAGGPSLNQPPETQCECPSPSRTASGHVTRQHTVGAFLSEETNFQEIL